MKDRTFARVWWVCFVLAIANGIAQVILWSGAKP